MEETNIQPVLRCPQCNKPFDKQSTLKRHGYYCRTRTTGPAHRPQACISCAKGKARCDNKRPECSRCAAKGIACKYLARPPRGTAGVVQRSHNEPTDQPQVAPSVVSQAPDVENQRDISNGDDDLFLDGTFTIPGLDFPYFGGDYLGWADSTTEFSNFLGPSTAKLDLQYPSPDSSIHASRRSVDQVAQTHQNLANSIASIPPVPSSTPRSLVERHNPKPGAQRITSLILHTLKSYPLMMLHNNTLPPFIHSGFLSSNMENDDMEPLHNCISLIHMIDNGIKGSRKLFWKNVRLECARWREELSSMNRWELLAAVQALSIYILIRLVEGETDENNVDSLLMTTMVALSAELAKGDTLCNFNLGVNWKDWVFDESRRRLSVVYRIVNMLVFFEPADLCALQKDLTIAPLPANKLLWEAGDEYAWKTQSGKESETQDAFGLAASGELVKLYTGQQYCKNALLRYEPLERNNEPGNTTNWEKWCSGMDGMGALVMLAASMAE